jgi:catechol 2,3-dioxygenase
MRLGHVHLRVADVARSTDFYCGLLELDMSADGRELGLPIAFLADDAYHHSIAVNSMYSPGGSAPPDGHTGLHHVAFAYEDRDALVAAVRRVTEAGYPLDGAQDHGATVSVYLDDPDGNGVELYYDRPPEDWHDENGRPVLKAEPIDPHRLP